MVEVGEEADLSSLLDRVERGEEVVITRRGKPVARLVATVEDREMTGAELVEAFRAARKGMRLGGLSIKELINEGRR